MAVDPVSPLQRASKAAFCRSIAVPVSIRAGVTAFRRYCDVVDVNSGWLLGKLQNRGIGLVDAGKRALECLALDLGCATARPELAEFANAGIKAPAGALADAMVNAAAAR